MQEPDRPLDHLRQAWLLAARLDIIAERQRIFCEQTQHARTSPCSNRRELRLRADDSEVVLYRFVREVSSVAVIFSGFGSGNHSQTFLHLDPRGRLIELPLSWYSGRGGYWAMSPGYDRPDRGGR